jgi:hypothetical protein
MFEFILIVLLAITILLFVAVCVVGAYVYWVALWRPLLWIAADALRWMYHRYFVPPASHYEELRRELRNR